MQSLRDSSSKTNEMIEWEIWEFVRPGMEGETTILILGMKVMIIIEPWEKKGKVGNKKTDIIWKYLQQKKGETFTIYFNDRYTDGNFPNLPSVSKLRRKGSDSREIVKEHIDRYFASNNSDYFKLLIFLGLQTDWVL